MACGKPGTQGHNVVLFTPEFSEAAWGTIGERPFDVHLLKFKKYRSTLKTNREAGAALGEALSLYEFDVVNPHNYPASLWVYYAKQRKKSFPRVVFFLHNLARNFYGEIIDVHYGKLPGFRNIWNRYRPKKLLRSLRQAIFNYRRLDQEAARAFDKVLANSIYTAGLASKIYKRDVHPCTLGVPLDRLQRRYDSSRPNIVAHGHSITVLTVARIELQKNFDTILRAVKILKEKPFCPEGSNIK
jgi:glycosyltransferase involved in cell wall biosynthesis